MSLSPTAALRHCGDLFALGPPLRGVRYETTAIPEIRAQAAVLAGRLAALGRSRRRRIERVR